MLSYQEVVDLIAVLHPPANLSDELPPKPPDLRPLVLSTKEVLESIHKLDRRSSAGNTGWTNRLIYSIFTSGQSEEDHLIDCEILTNMLNCMLAGSLRRSYWTVCRSILIPKYSSDLSSVKWRPLGIGDAFYRLMGKCAVKHVSPAIASLIGPRSVGPMQLAVGVRCGTEIFANVAQHILDFSGILILLDMKNAYNTMRRTLPLAGLLKYCPELIDLYYWSYGYQRILVNSKGEVIGYAGTGTSQGDPPAGLFFCLGLQAILHQLRDKVRDLATTHPIVFAYADDTAVGGAAEDAKLICDIIQRCFEEAQLELVPSKCTILWNGKGNLPSDLPFPVVNVSIPGEGRVVVGNPVGGEEYRKETLIKLGKKHAKPIQGLCKLHPIAAYLLLYLCINPRLTYLTRLNHPLLAKDMLINFDQAVDAGLLSICCASGVTNSAVLNQPLLRDISIIRSLPMDLAGLAMMRHSGLVGQSGYMTSHSIVKAVLTKHKDLTCLLGSFSAAPPVWLGYDPDNPIIGFDQAVLSEEDMKSLPSTLLDLQNAAAHRFHKSLLTPDENGHVRAAEAAIFGSNIYKGSGRMFSCHEIIATSPETFRELLRLRLLINPVMDIVVPNVPVRCACNYVIATAQDAYHLLNCNNVQFLRTRRHTRVKVQVHEHIEKILPKLEYTVEPEFKIGDALRKGDLLIQDKSIGLRRMVDFVVSDPTTTTNLNSRSFDDPFVTTAQAEKVKFSYYHGSEYVQLDIFSPFAVTSTGQLGFHALKLLDYLRVTYGLIDSVWSKLRHQISRTCLLSLAEMIAYGRNRLRFGTMVTVG